MWKLKKSILNPLLKIVFVLYCLAIIFWNATKTDLPDPLFQKVKIVSLEKGEYYTSWFETTGPFNQKILVNHKDIGGLFCNSKQKGFNQIVAGKELLLQIECIEATSWWDFFTFGRNFNYRLVSIPNQKNSIEVDSLIFTTNFWVVSSIISVFAFFYLFGRFIKNK
jgi:hypothetical protein